MAGGFDNKRYGSQKGLTLVEVMVAMIIIAMSVMAMYIMFINGTELIGEQYHRRIALERARAIMEDMSYSRRENGVVPITFRASDIDTLIASSDDHVGIVAEYTVTVDPSAEFDEDTGFPYYSMVSVLYEWEELSGRPYHIELRSAF